MIRRLLATRPARWLLHRLELDHSPSLSMIGRCPCASCAKIWRGDTPLTLIEKAMRRGRLPA